MSSKIYFNENNRRNFSWWLARGITNSILTLPRVISVKAGKKMLLRPVRNKSISIPQNMTLQTVKTIEGDIQTYIIGTGPIILLSHGWSGSASQFFPLMARIAEAGYQAVAYDQIAHGNSSGDLSNLFLFMKIKLAMIAWLEREQPIAAVVTHSMGAYASLAALTSPYPILLIAPVFKLFESMIERVKQSGMAPQ
ncbi:alpha/beta fold hydrolase [Shewanella sp. SG41-4]|uniref:alpha/beta hydrolase n=1 Tax=Shewanella sp. SG41-4 TaxID=2760976 RepID=UPI0015FF8C1C|nr:alpha/beta fold hydrolase [Shewanella sp. SG41-4]MBB1440047.1 alpha/beta fold hydrolase [Shewanella sp. SG41-4]